MLYSFDVVWLKCKCKCIAGMRGRGLKIRMPSIGNDLVKQDFSPPNMDDIQRWMAAAFDLVTFHICNIYNVTSGSNVQCG